MTGEIIIWLEIFLNNNSNIFLLFNVMKGSVSANFDLSKNEMVCRRTWNEMFISSYYLEFIFALIINLSNYLILII